MTCSAAKLESNRRNAALSTGPKTPEGKDASRRNALKHGLTGDGIVVPDEDLARIARVAEDLRTEHSPTTTTGLAMIDRAAMLLVRLDRAGKQELAMVADQVNAAVYDFDQARRDWADELFDRLDDDPSALVEMKRFPEGLDRLIAEWSSFGPTERWSAGDLERAARLWEPESLDPAGPRFSVDDEVRRLEALKASIDRRPIDRARKQAADLALFSDSPEATLARRYEAATERAFHKAMKTMREAEAPRSVFPAPEIPQADTPVEPVGSFSPAMAARPASRPMPEPTVKQVTPDPQVDRSKRPDPRKLREAQARKRR